MQTAIPLLCLFVVVLSAEKCWRSGEEEEKVCYTKGQPLRRRHKIALDRILNFYSKHKLGESPFKSVQFAGTYTLTLRHFTVLMDNGNIYSLEDVSGFVEGVSLKAVVFSTDLKKNEAVEITNTVYQDFFKRCKQTAILNGEQQL